jgi:1-acyl-sn-glycerol-3-phosphate acyltransferase
MNKLEQLKKLRDELGIVVNNLDNYPIDEPAIVIANHNCLMDIFYLPMALPNESVSLVSARLMYKREKERQQMVNEYLYPMPIEAHGGKAYSDMCLKYASDIVTNDISVNIFPEGAYVEENVIYKGRTGASRILFDAKEKGKNAYFIPVAINVKNDNLDMDSYSLSNGNQVEISILEPINCDDFYYAYTHSNDTEDRNKALHMPVDIGMMEIARVLKREYVDEYIRLRPKGNVIFDNGSVVDTIDAQDDKYITYYSDSLETQSKKLIKSLNK